MPKSFPVSGQYNKIGVSNPDFVLDRPGGRSLHNGCNFYLSALDYGNNDGIQYTYSEKVLIYEYSAWGQVLYTNSADIPLSLNPLRYRGYVYDVETDLYYLQSRYYDPQMGRFLNADGLTSTGQGLTGNNMFAYCGNNAVLFCDPCGYCLHRWDFWKDCKRCKGKSFCEQIGILANDACNAAKSVGAFFVNVVDAFSQSISISGEVGYGIGLNGSIGTVEVDATAIIVGDEWSLAPNGAKTSKRKASLTIEAELVDNISAGLDLEYNVPLAAGREKGLLGAGKGKFNGSVGLSAFDHTAGWSNISTSDVEVSLGVGGYFIMGGGVEISLNLSKFWRLVTD